MPIHYKKYVWEDAEDTIRVPYEYKSVMYYPYFSYAEEGKAAMTLTGLTVIYRENEFLINS